MKRSLCIVWGLGILLGCGEDTESQPAEAVQEAQETQAGTPSEVTEPLAAPDFRPPCLERVSEVEPTPPRLTQLGGEQHAGSRLIRTFAREGRTSPTETGYQPAGHVFRWTLAEVVGEPRGSFPNDQFRGRIVTIQPGARITEGFENRQIRTLEARLPTQSAQETILTILNSRDPERLSTASLTCVDHGALAGLTVTHFHDAGWLPESLSALVGVAPQARVLELHNDGPDSSAVLDAVDEDAVRGSGLSLRQTENGYVIEPS